MLQYACCQAPVHETREPDDPPSIPWFTMGTGACLDPNLSRRAFFGVRKGNAAMSTLETSPVPLTLGGITIEDLSLIAIEGAPLAVAAEVDQRIQASRAVIEHALARDQLVYGLTSQVGHGRDQRVDPEAL